MRWQAREKGTSPSSSPSGATPPAAPADAGLPSEAPATELAEAVAALRALDHVPAAHAALFERVCAAQWRARQCLSGKAFYQALSAEAASQRLSNGSHLIDFARLRLDEAELRPLWEGLSAVLAEFGELSPAQAERGRKLAAGDIATLYVDVLARRKGYKPPWQALPGRSVAGKDRLPGRPAAAKTTIQGGDRD